MNRDEILNKLHIHISLLKEKYPIKEIGIFGSVARGEGKEESDIDILAEFSSPIGLFDFIHLENELSTLLGKKVDLVSKKAIKPAIREVILNETVYV